MIVVTQGRRRRIDTRVGVALLVVAVVSIGALFASPAYAASVGWNVLNHGSDMGVACNGANEAWVAWGQGGGVCNTTDGGATWTTQESTGMNSDSSVATGTCRF